MKSVVCVSWTQCKQNGYCDVRRKRHPGYAFFTRRASERKITAPAKATTIVPSMPQKGNPPRRPKTQPPMTAPTMPRTISISTPKPPPFITFPASHPAMNPTMHHQSKPLSTGASCAPSYRVPTGVLSQCDAQKSVAPSCSHTATQGVGKRRRLPRSSSSKNGWVLVRNGKWQRFGAVEGSTSSNEIQTSDHPLCSRTGQNLSACSGVAYESHSAFDPTH